MFINLTNASEAFKGLPIAIKKDLIVTVHSNEDKSVTYIFVPPHGTWEVSEKYEDVIEMLA